MEHLSPSETVTQLLKNVSGKEADVLRRRFGLNGQTKQTLEEIGKGYNVTRERIRQIERLTITKIKSLKDFEESIQAMKAAVTQVLTSHGGFLEEQALLKTLLQIAGDIPENSNAVTFLLGELLGDHFDRVEATRSVRVGWKLRHASLERLESLIAALAAFFKTAGTPMAIDDLVREFHQTPFAQGAAETPTEETIAAAVDMAKHLGHNPFGEYGLLEWGQIHPRRMNDKIYLVLKKKGEPMHFTDIAQKINETAFDDRKAYPPTVHNELILDTHYVLVGRGIYALREWGYEPGVVAEVIAATIRDAGHPLTRKEIVEAVLKQRLVKKNTIHLALTNRERFMRRDDGTYALTEQPTPQTNASAPNRH